MDYIKDIAILGGCAAAGYLISRKLLKAIWK